jgi:hypothetical protein
MRYFGGGGAAVLSFLGLLSGAVTSGAGDGDGGAGPESGVCGEFGASVVPDDVGVAAGRVTTSVGASGR